MYVIFYDRLDRQYKLQVTVGQPISKLLLKNHIPLDAVIVKKKGRTVSDDYVVQNGDELVINMVRAYHLADYLRQIGVWQNSPATDSEAIYTKKVLWFNSDSEKEDEVLAAEFSKKTFPGFLEETFITCVKEKQLIKDGDTVGLALSGGRDSLSLLYLLANSGERLPNFNLKAVTVGGLSKDLDLTIAREACGKLGVAYEFYPESATRQNFGLSGSMDQALKAILEKYGRFKTINAVHAFMRTGVERYFDLVDVKKVAFGLHNEDLLASLLRSIVNGIIFGESLYNKTWGDFEYIYPLWGITKKELTIYLELIAPPKHSNQGSPTPFDRGGANRDMQYFLADSIQTLWPGFSIHAFEGYQRLTNQALNLIEHRQCENCKGFYQEDIRGLVKEKEINKVCHLCYMLCKTNQLK